MTAVSVLIRTTGRRAALRDALDSLLLQNFRDFEVVVVEDGPATLADFLSGYGGFSSSSLHPVTNSAEHTIPLRYEMLGTRKGRSTAGNRALAIAEGEYCLFLDEDDLLYPNHLKFLVEAVQAEKCAVAYSWSEERLADRSEDGTIVRRGRLKRYRRERFSLLHLIAGNYLPINVVLFNRALAIAVGGFDHDIDCLEDWLLWLRCAAREPDWRCVPKVTAVYHAPLDKRSRRKTFRRWHSAVDDRMRSIVFSCPLAALRLDLERHFFMVIFLRKLYYHLTGFIRW